MLLECVKMTKEEYKKQLAAALTSKETKEKAIKVFDHYKWLYGAWSHCSSCHRSNQRLNCLTVEDWVDLRNECLREKWKCSFCGGNLEINAGYSNGEGDIGVLPTRDDMIKKIEEQQ